MAFVYFGTNAFFSLGFMTARGLLIYCLQVVVRSFNVFCEFCVCVCVAEIDIEPRGKRIRGRCAGEGGGGKGGGGESGEAEGGPNHGD